MCSAGQREKTLDKHLHGLIEQLAVKQVPFTLHSIWSSAQHIGYCLRFQNCLIPLPLFLFYKKKIKRKNKNWQWPVNNCLIDHLHVKEFNKLPYSLNFQAQAEGLLGEIHLKEMELERLNGLWRRTESSNSEANTAARNRFSKGSSDKLHSLSDYEGHQRLPYHSAGRTESQQRLMLLRSAFVLYILALHILVFIRLSF